MASSCMSSICIEDNCHVINSPVRVRGTYVNLHKWPYSEIEFLRLRSGKNANDDMAIYSNVSSSRQLFLKSYKFSRKKQTIRQKIAAKCRRCFRLPRHRHHRRSGNGKGGVFLKRKKVCMAALLIRGVKALSWAALLFFLRRLRLLYCTTTVDSS